MGLAPPLPFNTCRFDSPFKFLCTRRRENLKTLIGIDRTEADGRMDSRGLRPMQLSDLLHCDFGNVNVSVGERKDIG
jgi:hypothetical protein